MDMNFVSALSVAKHTFGHHESMRIHPLRDTHANDVPVIAAELMVGIALAAQKEIDRLRAENGVLLDDVDAAEARVVELEQKERDRLKRIKMERFN